MDTRLVLGLLLVAGGGAVAAVAALPQAFLTPSQLADAPVGEHLSLKATVATLPESGLFVVTDGRTDVRVQWALPPPANLAPGRTVAVHGVLAEDEGGLLVVAHRVEVGCPSKYQPAADDATAGA